MPNLYLIGMMGSGKSVTGKKLAQFLKGSFVDLDDVIEKKNKKSISEIFAGEGELFFRDQESEVLNEVASQDKLVVATGGGVILRPENVDRMRASGRVIYLEASLDVLWKRVQEKGNRPLLKSASPQDKLKEIFLSRQPIYETVSEFQIATDGLSPETVAKNIKTQLEK